MYNRYIGNSGQFYRVEDVEPVPPPVSQALLPPDIPSAVESEYPTGAAPLAPPLPLPQWEQTPPPPPYDLPYQEGPPPPPLPYELPPPEEKSRFDIGAMLNMPGSLRGRLQGLVPERLDLGDILLVLVLIYLFLEGDDDDMLIILGVLAFTWIWPLFRKDEA